MADIINLRQVRKDKARAERERAAQANRSLFGRTKAERRLAETEADKATRDLDAHRLDRTQDKPDAPPNT